MTVQFSKINTHDKATHMMINGGCVRMKAHSKGDNAMTYHS
jgi:hypothetical protein